MKAACYLRQSLDRTGDGVAIARQQQDCIALCAEKGWEPVGYIDNDTSASNGKRPRYTQMLADIAAGHIGAVVCWDLDRLHRRPVELEAFMTLADQHHLALATVSGDVDLATAQGRLVARLKGAVARHEIEHKSARQRRQGSQRAELGIPKWRTAFGYREGPDGPEPDPVTAPLVRRAYAAILAGSSIKDIARTFNAVGAYGLTGRPWTQSSVSLFVRKPRNAGLRDYRGEIIGAGTWAPLVDESTWRAVQSILNTPGRAPGRRSVRRHVLTGVLMCGKCGMHLNGKWTTQKRIAYGCRACQGVSIRAEHVEPLLHAIVAGRLAKDDAIDLLRNNIHDDTEAEQIRTELNTLAEQLDSIGVERAEGLLTGRQAKIATDLITAKITTLQRRQQDCERLRVFDGIPLGRPEVAAAIAALSPDRYRAVLDVLLTVTIAPVGKAGRAFRPERVQVAWR